jgi:hypothetical protein
LFGRIRASLQRFLRRRSMSRQSSELDLDLGEILERAFRGPLRPLLRRQRRLGEFARRWSGSKLRKSDMSGEIHIHLHLPAPDNGGSDIREVKRIVTEILEQERIAMTQRDEILAKMDRHDKALTEIKADQDTLLEIINRQEVKDTLTPEDMEKLEGITARAEALAAFTPPAGGSTGGGTGGEGEV